MHFNCTKHTWKYSLRKIDFIEISHLLYIIYTWCYCTYNCVFNATHARQSHISLRKLHSLRFKVHTLMSTQTICIQKENAIKSDIVLLCATRVTSSALQSKQIKCQLSEITTHHQTTAFLGHMVNLTLRAAQCSHMTPSCVPPCHMHSGHADLWTGHYFM